MWQQYRFARCQKKQGLLAFTDRCRESTEGFERLTGKADLSVYFYECGVRLLSPAGTVAYISRNSLLNSGFGENSRRYLSANTRIRQLIDFAETKVVEAITGPGVICLTRDHAGSHEAKFLKGDQSTPPERIRKAFKIRSQTIHQSGNEVRVLAARRRH